MTHYTIIYEKISENNRLSSYNFPNLANLLANLIQPPKAFPNNLTAVSDHHKGARLI